jgi:hypothetical protein
MHKQDHLIPGQHPAVRTLRAIGRLAPRWLRLVGMLVLMLAIASTNDSVWAQGGDPTVDPDVQIHSYLIVEGPKEICKDTTETIKVTVRRDLKHTEKGLLEEESYWTLPVDQSGVKVTARVTGDSVKLLWSSVKTNTVLNEFNIDGVKRGSATVHFSAPLKRMPNEQMDGPIGKDTVQTDLKLEVVECNYRVSVDSRFQVPATAGAIRMVATYNALLKSDGEGKYKGEEGKKVTWTASTPLPGGCELDEDTIEGSKATLKGAVPKKGELEVQITFDPTSFHVTGGCKAGRGANKIDNTYQLSPKPLKVTVSKKGGTKTLQHKLTVAGMEVTGLTFVTVRPEKSGGRR